MGVNHGCCNMKIHGCLRYVFSFGEKVSGFKCQRTCRFQVSGFRFGDYKLCIKNTSFARFRLKPDPAIHELYRLFHCSQPDAGSRVFCLTVKSLKDIKYFFVKNKDVEEALGESPTLPTIQPQGEGGKRASLFS